MRLFNTQGGALVADLGKVLGSRWTVDSTRLATTHGDQILRIWQAASGALLDVHEGADVAESGGGYLMRLAFSADGSRLVTASQMGLVSICDLTKSALQASLPDPDAAQAAGFKVGGTWSSGISADGSRRLTVAESGETTLWEAASGRRIAILHDGRGGGSDVFAFSPDGKRLVIHHAKTEATELWNAENGRKIAALDAGPGATPFFSPDGTLLATRGFWLQVRQASDGQLLHQGAAGYYRKQVDFSPDSTYLTMVNLGGTVTILEARSGRPVGSFVDSSARQAIFAPTDSALLATMGGGAASIWDWRGSRLLARLSAHADVAESPAHLDGANAPVARLGQFSPSADRLAVAVPGGAILVWDTGLESRGAEELARIPERHLAPWKLMRVEGGRLVAAPPVARASSRPPLEKPQNLDMEGGTLGQPPAGWTLPPPGRGYRAALTDRDPRAGKRCALLEGSPWGASFAQLIESNRGGAPRGTMIGYLMQAIDATQYRGRKVRLRVAARNGTAGASGKAGASARPMRRVPGVFLWMRTDLTSEASASFDDTVDRPILSPDWQEYEVTSEIQRDAHVLSFGLAIFGDGKAWLDDVRLEIVEN